MDGGVGAAVELSRDQPLDPARTRAHHRNAVSQEHRLRHVMRDEHHRLAGAAPDGEQFFLHDPPRLCVQRTERLVHQQNIGINRQRAGNRRALLHAAGELGGKRLLEASQMHQIDVMLRPLLGLAAFDALLFQAITHVFDHRLPGKQCEILEHDTPIRPRLTDQSARGADGALLDLLKAADQKQQRRFAAAGRAEQGVELAGRDAQRHIVQRHRRLA